MLQVVNSRYLKILITLLATVFKLDRQAVVQKNSGHLELTILY
jgi:hypothetical protein